MFSLPCLIHTSHAQESIIIKSHIQSFSPKIITKPKGKKKSLLQKIKRKTLISQLETLTVQKAQYSENKEHQIVSQIKTFC